MTTSLLDTLVSLGTSYAQISGVGASPDDYARKVAHLAVRTLTADLGAEAPDSVAFFASINALSAMLASANLSARLADKGVGMSTAAKQYDTELTGKLTSRPLPPSALPDASTTSYEASLNSAQFQSLIEQVETAYEGIKKQKLSAGELPWSDKSCMRYLHAYACARAAYLHAIAISARYVDPKAKQLAFEMAIRTRLREDLMGEPISPGFFIQVMSSDAMKIAGIILLVIGMLAVSLFVAGFINPAAGVAISAMGLSGTILTPVAINGCILGGAIFTSRFFIQRNEREKSKLSQDAVENTNNITPQMSM